MDDRGRIDPMLAVYFVLGDVAEFERFLMEHITKVPCIATIKSSIMLKQVKYTTALPIEVDA